ncbi:MAG: hypothetical protein ACFNVM_02320 [Neisseria elongata]
MAQPCMWFSNTGGRLKNRFQTASTTPAAKMLYNSAFLPPSLFSDGLFE